MRHILDMDDPPDLIVVMGDHQPPMYKKSDDFSVPMHILARDPALLKGFRDHGFTDGARFGLPKGRIYHEGFFSLLVGAIAEAQDVQPPKFHRRGFGINTAKGE